MLNKIEKIWILIIILAMIGCSSKKEDQVANTHVNETSFKKALLDSAVAYNNIDTGFYHVILDTVLLLNQNEIVGLFNFIDRREEPCSHASSSELRFGLFSKISGGYICKKITEVDQRLIWCDGPDSKIIEVAGIPILITSMSDFHQGKGITYLHVYDLKEEGFGELLIERIVTTKKDSVIFNNPGKDDSEISFEFIGNISYDLSKKSTFRIVNDYSIVKNSPEVVNSDTIEKGVEFWEYVFEAGKLNLIKEHTRY